MTIFEGFADPVLGAQAAFRAVLEAMSRPGRVQRVAAGLVPPAPLQPAAAAVLLTLADADTAVWLDAGAEAEAWLRFHAGCPLVGDPGQAAFVLATGSAPALAALDQGTEEAPQDAATLILQVAELEEGIGLRLTGPGIEHEHRLHVGGLADGFLEQRAATFKRFPRGVDVILCAGDRLAALPRTTRIEVP